MLIRKAPGIGFAALVVPAVASLCADDSSIVKIQPVQVVLEQPFDVSAYVEDNCVFTVDDGVEVEVTNAPTTLVTQVTKTVSFCTTVEE